MKTFQYFMECYFNESENYEDLDIVIERFKKSTYQIYPKNLIKELDSIMNHQNYEKASLYIKKYGMRRMTLEKTKIFIQYLYDRLNDIPTDVQATDFYKIK